MKKFSIFLAIFLFSHLAHADMLCNKFKITIKNIGNTDCVLSGHRIYDGALYNGTQLPEVIFRDKSEQFEMVGIIGAYVGAILTYQCGDDKEITFLSRFPGTSRNPILDSKNMEAKMTWVNSNCVLGYGNPKEINWILNP